MKARINGRDYHVKSLIVTTGETRSVWNQKTGKWIVFTACIKRIVIKNLNKTISKN